MKKVTSIGILSMALLLAGAFAVFAVSGTITLSPTAKTVTAGQTFTVAVSVNPTAGSVYTAKAKVTYPANVLQVTSFTFASGWLPLTQSGYDSVDNTGGVLVKTAGYPGGLGSAKTLGTITFRAKTAGTATVAVVADGSMVLDAQSANVYAGGGSTTVTVNAPAATQTPTLGGTVTTATPTPSVAESPEISPQANDDVNQQVAAAGALLGLSKKSWGILLGILVLIVVGWWLMRRKSSGGTPPSAPQQPQQPQQ